VYASALSRWLSSSRGIHMVLRSPPSGPETAPTAWGTGVPPTPVPLRSGDGASGLDSRLLVTMIPGLWFQY
jgi:hypothetical protein